MRDTPKTDDEAIDGGTVRAVEFPGQDLPGDVKPRQAVGRKFVPRALADEREQGRLCPSYLIEQAVGDVLLRGDTDPVAFNPESQAQATAAGENGGCIIHRPTP